MSSLSLLSRGAKAYVRAQKFMYQIIKESTKNQSFNVIMCKIIKAQKLMCQIIKKSTKSQKKLILYYNIDYARK